MQKRLFHALNREVGVVGLGTWNLGGQWGELSESDALAILERALELGMDVIDTADAYGLQPGTSEELIGKVMKKHRREDVVIVSKAGNWARRMGFGIDVRHPLHVQMFCDASLYRLKTDYIDVYLCHLGNLQEPEVWLEGFERLREQGKIRCFGISTNNMEVLKRFNQAGTCAALEVDYSLINTDAENQILPYCLEHRIGVLVRGPMGKGICSGKYDRNSRFTDSVRIKWNDEQREDYLRKVALMERLRFLEKPDRPLAQAAIQFVISHPAVTAAIPGATKLAQVESNAAAGERGALSEDELTRIRAVLKTNG